LKTDSTSTIADDKIADYINDSSIVEVENIKTNHTNDSFNDYANLPMTEKTSIIPSSIRDKELDNYDVNMLQRISNMYCTFSE